MMSRRLVLAALLMAPSLPAFAADVELTDPALERRARALMGEIRCVVCQSQSIAESDAEIAADMRRLIRERVMAGDNDAAILDYLASRYGDFVRFRPPFKASTMALWLGPFAVLALALLAGFAYLRRRSGLAQRPATQPNDSAWRDAEPGNGRPDEEKQA
jgi:cytochrome c-type biogenesis protein CcmH